MLTIDTENVLADLNERQKEVALAYLTSGYKIVLYLEDDGQVFLRKGDHTIQVTESGNRHDWQGPLPG